ncbi:ABC transporter permease [Cereibacter sp. SYSU M97828]|nr:ABC transporter permease [Cereibacter flavus]
MNGRVRAALAAGVASAVIAGIALGAGDVQADFAQRNLEPSARHLFGTDAMGRDMLARTLGGLARSLRVGLIAAGLSVLIAAGVALASGLGRRADAVAGLLTDAFLAMPHLVLLILISFAMGGGTGAVIVAVAVSHWPRLARLLRAEVLQVQAAPYVEASRAFGRSRAHVLRRHVLPHLVPQMLVGFLLMFPHAILHEAGLTFLGFGLEPSRPAIGVMLAEAMRHVGAGRWWLALFPGAALLSVVLCFEALGSAVRRLASPREGQC